MARPVKTLRCCIGIDLGGTKIAAGLVDEDGTIVRRSKIPLNERGGAEVGRLVCHQIEGLARERPVQGVGIAVPGAAWKDGTVWAPNIPGWERYPLRREIAAIFNSKRVSVCIESDRTCYILGEAWQGAARGCANAIFLAVGTGIGAGILVDGRVLHGADGLAGAAGWMALQRPFVAAYRDCGCLERHASGRGMNARSVFADVRRGNPPARNKIRLAVQLWGMAAANLVSLFNPEKIIFGGGVFGPAACLLKQVRAEAGQWAQPLAMQRVKFEVSALGGEAGLYGAAWLALQAQAKRK